MWNGLGGRLYECLLFHLDYGFREAPAYNSMGAPMLNDTFGNTDHNIFTNAVPFFFDFSCTYPHNTQPAHDNSVSQRSVQTLAVV